jgi:hypothetical protein
MISNGDIRNYLKKYVSDQEEHEETKRIKKLLIMNSNLEKYKEKWIEYNKLIYPKYLDFQSYLIHIQAL